ncbi:MAG: hypothetical protein N2117_11740 [Anaerolineales bacterium]|nr:hypothetical protein [Anaerolineales bacterium]MCX7755898.1 hypothetical protein [Anaerolineales bacterium]MDW8277938.1 hypothetical protein [Anaerolineales bacterium]
MKILHRHWILVGLAIFLGVAVFASQLPNADWDGTYRPVVESVLQGQNPYTVRTFANPPWTVLLLLPFAFFHPEFARGLFFAASVAVFFWIAWKVKAPPLAAIALFLSPTFIGGLLANNLDIFVLAGVLLPPAWGLFVLFIKPQLGFGAAIYYLVDAWKTDRWRRVFATFAPVTLGLALTFVLFPVLAERLFFMPSVNPWNRSIFPYGVPLGLLFLWLAIRNRNPFLALAVGPLISPYTTLYSYAAVQIALLHEDVEQWIRRDVLQILLTVFLWAVTLIFRL